MRTPVILLRICMSSYFRLTVVFFFFRSRLPNDPVIYFKVCFLLWSAFYCQNLWSSALIFLFLSFERALRFSLRSGTNSSFAAWPGTSPLAQEHFHKLLYGVWGARLLGVSLTSWPTSASTLLQTKAPSIIHPSQAYKNVNKEQKLLVLHISEGLFRKRALLKLIPLQVWPWPFLFAPFSESSSTQRSATDCLLLLSHIGRHWVSL